MLRLLRRIWRKLTRPWRRPPAYATWAREPDIYRDLFLVVGGGSIPTLQMGPPAALNIAAGEYCGNVPPTKPILTMRPCFNGYTDSTDQSPPTRPTGSVWYEMPRGGFPENLWPRRTAFRVDHDIAIGTIDALVDDYRKKLIRAAMIYVHGHETDEAQIAPMWGGGARGEQHYAAVQEELGRHYYVHQSPFDYVPAVHLPIPWNPAEMARFDTELASRGGRYGIICLECGNEYRSNNPPAEPGEAVCPVCLPKRSQPAYRRLAVDDGAGES